MVREISWYTGLCYNGTRLYRVIVILKQIVITNNVEVLNRINIWWTKYDDVLNKDVS